MNDQNVKTAFTNLRKYCRNNIAFASNQQGDNKYKCDAHYRTDNIKWCLKITADKVNFMYEWRKYIEQRYR